jgi:hypothetical protein
MMTPIRDARGRYLPGHTAGGPGRPKRQAEADYLARMTAICTVEYWDVIVKRAIHDAAHGDATARKWLGDYLLPRPPATLDIRATDAAILADVLKALQAHGLTASAVFNAMLAELATGGDDGRGDAD